MVDQSQCLVAPRPQQHQYRGLPLLFNCDAPRAGEDPVRSPTTGPDASA
jgi:hypothetical protein